METTPQRLLVRLLACALCLVMLGGSACATRTPPDVGVVVDAPKVQLPPVPPIVLETPPKPAGYFQSSLNDYFSGSKAKPTPSTAPMPPAASTR